MTIRSRRETVTFTRPARIKGIGRELAAGADAKKILALGAPVAVPKRKA